MQSLIKTVTHKKSVENQSQIISKPNCRLSGLENELLGLNSRVNSVVWSHSSTEIENIDVICFGHLLFEMCAGYELSSPTPSKAHLQLDLERYPQVNHFKNALSIRNWLILGSFPFAYNRIPGGRSHTNDIRVARRLSDTRRARALRPVSQHRSTRNAVWQLCACKRLSFLIKANNDGNPSILQSFKHSLSSSTMSLLNAVRKRHNVMQGSFSEGSSPCTPPSTPRDRQGWESHYLFTILNGFFFHFVFFVCMKSGPKKENRSSSTLK